MGKATLELPDPVEEAPLKTDVSADELLSQLAGAEIERLLADGENKSAPAALAAPPASGGSAEKGVPELQTQLDDLFTKLNTSFEDPSPEAIAQAESAPAVAPAAEVAEQVTASAAAAVAAELEENDRASLTAPLRGALRDMNGELAPVLDYHAEPESERLPLFLRPLEWLNAPLAGASESARQAIGKVALVTLLNAVAILVYVLLFRKS